MHCGAFLFDSSRFSLLQNLCVTAAHRPIREILEKEKKVCLSNPMDE